MSKMDKTGHGNVVLFNNLKQGGLSQEMSARASNKPSSIDSVDIPNDSEADIAALDAAGEENYNLAARQMRHAYNHAVQVFGKEIASAMYSDANVTGNQDTSEISFPDFTPDGA